MLSNIRLSRMTPISLRDQSSNLTNYHQIFLSFFCTEKANWRRPSQTTSTSHHINVRCQM